MRREFDCFEGPRRERASRSRGRAAASGGEDVDVDVEVDDGVDSGSDSDGDLEPANKKLVVADESGGDGAGGVRAAAAASTPTSSGRPSRSSAAGRRVGERSQRSSHRAPRGRGAAAAAVPGTATDSGARDASRQPCPATMRCEVLVQFDENGRFVRTMTVVSASPLKSHVHARDSARLAAILPDIPAAKAEAYIPFVRGVARRLLSHSVACVCVCVCLCACVRVCVRVCACVFGCGECVEFEWRKRVGLL